MTEDDKILQIISADGWFAVHRGEGKSDTVEPVVCFALVEITDEGKSTRMVRPMSWTDDMIDFSDEASTFSGLVRGDDLQDDEEDEE